MIRFGRISSLHLYLKVLHLRGWPFCAETTHYEKYACLVRSCPLVQLQLSCLAQGDRWWSFLELENELTAPPFHVG